MKLLLTAMIFVTPLLAQASTDLFGHADPPTFSLQDRLAVYSLEHGKGNCPTLVHATGAMNCEGSDCQNAVEIKELNVTFNTDHFDDTHFHFKSSNEPQDSNDVLNEGDWDYTFARYKYGECKAPNAHCKYSADETLRTVKGDLVWKRGVRDLEVTLNRFDVESTPSGLGSLFGASPSPRKITRSGSSLDCSYRLTSLKSTARATAYEPLRRN